MNDEDMAGLHKALSLPVRVRILRLIADRPLCVNAITGLLRISQPAVSQHLAVLRRAGLVRGQKSGYMVHYSLNQGRLREFREAVGSFPGAPPRTAGGESETVAGTPLAKLATNEGQEPAEGGIVCAARNTGGDAAVRNPTA